MKPLCALRHLPHTATLLAGALFVLQAPSPAQVEQPVWSKPLPASRQAGHVLNRLAFGPRPGDVEKVERQGVQAWIEGQLSPATLDDSATQGRSEAAFKVLQLDPKTLMLAYAGDTMRVVREARKAQMEAERRQGKNARATPAAAPQMEALPRRAQQLMDRLEEENLDYGTSHQAVGELISDKLLRAIESKRQLQEVLVDFWSNHFNEDVKKGPVAALKVPDERYVIRPNLYGSFRRLLGATAKSPAMLLYLDNALSTVENQNVLGKKRGGINENYARELMELHTLGVDGGYTQKDVQEVARCFTGWGVVRATGQYRFSPGQHDNGPKVVLGVNIPAGGGEKDGEAVLDILAKHPATARFLAQKLCMRFVSDTPPTSLVDKVAAAFTRSQGDLPTTYRALFFSPEFLSEGAYRAKIKSPFEFVVSSVRALGGTYTPPDAATMGGRARLIHMGTLSVRPNRGKRQPRPTLAAEIGAMGQPLFSCQPPTGYSENSSSWVSSSALVARLNYALALTGGRIADVNLTADTYRGATVAEASATLVTGDLHTATVATLEKELAAAPTDGARLRALILGTPEFQRR